MPRTSSKLLAAAMVGLAALGFAPARADTTALWDGAVANWTDAAHWSSTPAFPNNGGGNFFDAVISAGAVTLNQNIALNQLTLSGGALDGVSSLTASEGLQWTGGTIRGTGVLSLGSAAATTISSGVQPLILSTRTVNLSGATTFSAGTIRGGFGATINNLAGATFTALNDAAFFADTVSPSYAFENAGTFIARSTAGSGFTTMDGRFDNTGLVRVELSGTALAHTLSLAEGGAHSGSFQLATGTTLELGGTTSLLGGASFTGGGTAVVAGAVSLAGNVTADRLNVAVGDLNIGGSTLAARISGTQTGGTVRVGAGGTLRVGSGTGTWIMQDGTLNGSGTLDADLDTQGEVAPGSGLGTLTVTGDAILREDARLSLEIGGASAGAFDRLMLGGQALLGGKIEISLTQGFQPNPNSMFQVLTAAGGVTGTFLNAPLDGQRVGTVDGLGSFQIGYQAGAVVLTGFIPEPCTGLLVLAGGAATFGKRRKRATVYS